MRHRSAIDMRDVASCYHARRRRSVQHRRSSERSLQWNRWRERLRKVHLQRLQGEVKVARIEASGTESHSANGDHSVPARASVIECHVGVDVERMLSALELCSTGQDALSWRLEARKDPL